MRNKTPAFLLLIFTLSSLTLWQLWEQDIFWILRCGEEFLAQSNLRCINNWSNFSDFSNWVNIYWFSEPLLYIVENTFGLGGLIIMRAILVFIFLFGCLLLLQLNKNLSNDLKALLLVTIFAVCTFRFQIRPDFLAWSTFPYVFVIFYSSISVKLKKILIVALAVVTLNLHSGIGLLFVFSSGVLFLPRQPRRADFLFYFLLFTCIACTPAGVHIFKVVLSASGIDASAMMKNTEWEAFNLGLFQRADTRLSAFMLTLLLISSIWLLFKRRAEILKNDLLTNNLILAILFFILTIMRYRSAPILAVILFPLIVLPVKVRLTSKKLLRKTIISILIIAILALFFITSPYKYSLSLASIYPEKAIAFIRNIKPQGQLMHEASTGNYMHRFLRDYKVFIDTRESIFWHIEKKIFLAGSSPEAMAALVSEYNINSLVLPIKPVSISGSEVIDWQERLFPSSAWATVYFDEQYFVAIKRIIEHKDLVASFEYKYLKSNHPPFLAVFKVNASELPLVSQEVSRCLQQNRYNYICQAADIFLEMREGHQNDMDNKYKSYLRESDQLSSYLYDLLPLLRYFGYSHEAKRLECLVTSRCSN